MTRVMVVDDAKAIRRAAKLFLEKEKIDVVEAEDGFSALAQLRNEVADILFLDITMPRLDGYQTCILLRQMPEFENLPIIMLSGKDSAFDRAQGSMSGCTDYLTKPFTKETLIATVKKYARLT